MLTYADIQHISVLILLYMCPHTTHMSSYYYICVSGDLPQRFLSFLLSLLGLLQVCERVWREQQPDMICNFTTGKKILITPPKKVPRVLVLLQLLGD
jgi:hypothetical protein